MIKWKLINNVGEILHISRVKQFFVLLFMLSITIAGHAMLDENTLIQFRSKLNSEIIAATFGSYGVEVLHEDNESRLSNLYSDDKIMRTCAIVDYSLPIHESLTQAHKEIVAGGSIGATLKKHGFTLTKKPRYFGEVRLTESLKKAMRVGTEIGTVHIYDLYVGENRYCTITEIHSPVYLNAHSLKLLYPNEHEQYLTTTPEVRRLLDKASTLDLSVYGKDTQSIHDQSHWDWVLQHPYLLTASIGVPLFLIINSRLNLIDFGRTVDRCSKWIAEANFSTFFTCHQGVLNDNGPTTLQLR